MLLLADYCESFVGQTTRAELDEEYYFQCLNVPKWTLMKCPKESKYFDLEKGRCVPFNGSPMIESEEKVAEEKVFNLTELEISKYFP